MTVNVYDRLEHFFVKESLILGNSRIIHAQDHLVK